MPEIKSFEVYSSASNAVIVRDPGRNFPGVLIQGDTLRTFLDDVEELENSLTTGNAGAASAVAAALRNRLRQILTHYERVLEANDQSLPYANSVVPRTDSAK